MYAKICGIKNIKTLEFINNHKYPPKFLGFIYNYPKSKRNLNLEQLKLLTNFKKKNEIHFVSVLVKPDDQTLNELDKLNFSYLQLYDVSPDRTKEIKRRFKIKIISAITVENLEDVKKFTQYKSVSDIILFDSKGYENSVGFNHELLNVVPSNITKMIAGNIQYNDNLAKFKKISDIIDISGSLETNGEKDLNKIDIFLENIIKI